ncbi:MAG: hypothetical protein ACE5ER_08815 [Nitrospinaceae bacterium]
MDEQTSVTQQMVEIAMETTQGSSEISLNIQDVARLAADTNQGANDSLNAASELAKMAAELQSIVTQGQGQT